MKTRLAVVAGVRTTRTTYCFGSLSISVSRTNSDMSLIKRCNKEPKVQQFSPRKRSGGRQLMVTVFLEHSMTNQRPVLSVGNKWMAWSLCLFLKDPDSNVVQRPKWRAAREQKVRPPQVARIIIITQMGSFQFNNSELPNQTWKVARVFQYHIASDCCWKCCFYNQDAPSEASQSY